MNKTIILKVLAKMLAVEAGLLIIPAIVSTLYGEVFTALCFLLTALAVTLLCLPAFFLKKKSDSSIYAKEGLVIVGIAWMAWSVVGAVPLTLCGDIPSFVDALFETVSGFTTTGATILTDIESLSKGGLFWRSFTHWIGGMGVLVLVMAIIPVSDNSSMHLMRAEVPGPTVGKLVPKGKTTAKILYLIYLALTLVEVIFLICGGMPLYDSFVHAFGTAGTGGFSVKNMGIAYYDSSYINWVITVFMILFGINFNIYFFLIIGKFRDVLKNGELKVYLGIICAAAAAITIKIYPLFGSVGKAVEHAAFQVASIITTTGYATVDFNLWDSFSKTVLLFLMVTGACAGSTGGGIKISRVIIMVKTCSRSIKKLIHPKSVNVIRTNEKIVDMNTMHGVSVYVVMYMLIIMASLLAVSLDGFDTETNFTAVLSCINNVGPGLGLVGPMGNYSEFSPVVKLVFCFDMLLGRLEIFPLLMLFSPNVWRRKFI